MLPFKFCLFKLAFRLNKNLHIRLEPMKKRAN